MFSRRERLSRTQFPAVLKKGRRLSSEHFVIVISEEFEGYAVVIPKKTIRLSSVRHRLKRQILEALREMQLPKAGIIFPRASAYGVNYQDIQAELRALIPTRN